MKIAIVNPLFKYEQGRRYEKYYIRSGSRWPHSGIKRKGTLPHYLPFPFFLAYSAALLRREKFGVYLLDAVALDMGKEEFLARLKEEKPDLIFYEITTPTFRFDLTLAKSLKALLPHALVAWGGTHASVFGDEILARHPEVDFILKGEYERSLLELARMLREGKLDSVAGILYREGGKIIDAGFPELIAPLDWLPYPARDIFPSSDQSNILVYWDGFCQFYPAVQMQASRGCPYRCYFCLWNQVIYNNGRYRTFSPRRVVDEMEEIKEKYGAREIYFDDDDFTIDRKHVLSICSEIRKRSLDIKWSCMADAINLDEDLLSEMARSGCIGIKFGIESASPRVLQKIGKPVNLQKAKKIARLCEKYRIKSHASFSLGLLDETPQDIEQTVRFAQNLRVNSIQVSLAIPYPGTKFFQMLEKSRNFERGDWELYDGKVSKLAVVSTPNAKILERKRGQILPSRWLLRKLISPLSLYSQGYVFLRTLRGLGMKRFIRNFFSLIIDEKRNN